MIKRLFQKNAATEQEGAVPAALPSAARSRARWHFYTQFGRMMLLPLAVLSLAGLLMTLGDGLDRRGLSWAMLLVQAGLVLYRYAPLMVAVSLAAHLVGRHRGFAALAAALASLVWQQTGSAMAQFLSGGQVSTGFNLGWLSGLAVGLLVVLLMRLCERQAASARFRWLANPEAAVLLAIVLAGIGGVLAGLLWHVLAGLLLRLAAWIPEAGNIGLFVYGLLNRLLLPFNLHHVMNNALWFEYGQFTTQSGILVSGDVGRFLSGDPTAGRFAAGFYPIMMFALPAAALAIYLSGRTQKKKLPGLLLLAAALTSLISGVTEPLDLLILLISPILFVLLGAATGLSLVLSGQMQIRQGFSFSTGLLDYLYTWSLATRPEYLLVIGAILAVAVFVVFYILMVRLGWTGPVATIHVTDLRPAVVPEPTPSAPLVSAPDAALPGPELTTEPEASTGLESPTEPESEPAEPEPESEPVSQDPPTDTALHE